MPTNIPFGSEQARVFQSAHLFVGAMQRKSKLNRLAGKFPTQADAENKLRNQTSTDFPIVRCMDLKQMAGDEVTFDIVNRLNGIPIMGSEMAEGRGEEITFGQDRLRINQTRKPISAGDTMSQQRTPYQLRKLAQVLGMDFMGRFEDELTIVHMAGARGFINNANWIMPLMTDPEFAKLCVNPVKAPTLNRHYIVDGDAVKQISATANAIDIATTDLFTMDTVDNINSLMDMMAIPPDYCKFDGDEAADDEPIRVLLVSPAQYSSFKRSNSGKFRELQASAMARASMAKNNPLFRGEVGLWDNTLIIKMPRAIRFFAGDPIYHGTSVTNATEITTDLVPASFGTDYAVDRAILLGSQALGEAFGKHRKSKGPYNFSEKELDHDDKYEILLGTVGGKSKIRFELDHGATDGIQPTDHGITVFDTVVKL